MRSKKLTTAAKTSLPIVVLKEIARVLRRRFPDLRIEAHPVSGDAASLFIGRRDKENSLNIQFQVAFPATIPGHECDYTALYTLALDGQRRKGKSRPIPNNQNSIGINIQEPKSIEELENWIIGLVDYLYAFSHD